MKTDLEKIQDFVNELFDNGDEAILEAEFEELNGWEAESDASRLLQGLGIGTELHYDSMATLDPRLKVKVLLAQALFGKPDIILLDEPTNHLDIQAIEWLEDFLMDCEALTLVVSHDRHFLNTVCSHICDFDYGKVIFRVDTDNSCFPIRFFLIESYSKTVCISNNMIICDYITVF